MQLNDVLKKRQSFRRFSSKPVSWGQVAEILDAGAKAPMAGNVYTIRFIVVSERENIEKIAEASVQSFISDSPFLIVVCSDNTQIIRLYEERGLRYSRQQAGAAVQNMLLKIADLGLASCWVGAYYDDAIKRILGIPDKMEVEAVIPVARKPALSAGVKRKDIDLKNIVYFERYGQKTAKPVKKIEAR